MNETEVRALLVRGTEDRPPGLNLMAAVPTAPPRGSLVVPLAVAAAVAVAVSMIALALPLGPPSAQAQVAAAVETTSQQSYRIHGTSGDRAFEGAFDPVRRVGVITTVGEGAETRFIGDLMYVRAQGATTWEVSPRMEVATAPMTVAVVKLMVLDPAQTLQRLRSATDVREDGTASGDDWTGKRFTFTLTDKDEPKADALRTITGALDVDDQGRVRRLQLNFSDTGTVNIINFGDFGVPVTVTAPPAGDVTQPPAGKQDGGKPSKGPDDGTSTARTGKPGSK
ncbi:hypothetical protein ACFPIJ_28780 [Dactylosporangium cerinum]|uniref:Outer membrane lipoprotein carrier protein LolA n=1 Tax=Dactylosporangium cerinum TaxID=1434730 RepID=A0ABV9W290_9ACTN